MLQDFYLRVIFPRMNYGLISWGACCHADNLDFLERLHCRAATIIFNLPKDMASPKLFNSFNTEIQNADRFSQFKFKLKTFLLN